MELTWSSPLLPLLALSIPLTLALAGLVAPRHAAAATGAALAAALLFTVGVWGAGPGAALGVRGDVVTCVMLLLVAGLGAVVVRYSRAALDRDPGLERYLRWLLLTLAAVTVLVPSDNLLVIALAWAAASVTLHQLLTWFSERPAALVAAHKKFLVSRLADLALAGALWLVHVHVGSFDLGQLATWVGARPALPPAMEAAALLLVMAVALRSAQLPFHGWITQVMEAPTPVSALLHAGVVNIGGFVLIRLAPWLTHAGPARLALVVIGLVTTVVAALVMTTRVSVKVALAWSTCAQMGFILVQCGLGLWPLALLHLVAHSLYKAHAFLSAGSTVEAWSTQALAGRAPGLTPRRLALATVAGLVVAPLAVIGARPVLGLPPLSVDAAAGLSLLLGLAPVPLFTSSRPGDLGAIVQRALVVVLLALGWHALAEHLLPAPMESTSALGWWLTCAGVVSLFAVKSALQLRPSGVFARALHPWLFSGLYLDEFFTAVTFRVWPPRPARATHGEQPPRAPAALEVHS